MKNKFLFLLTLAFILVVTRSANCRKNKPDVENNGCHIKEVKTNGSGPYGSGVNSTSNSTQSYEYNEQALLTREAYQQNFNLSNSKKSNTAQTINYLYNGAGFLMKEVKTTSNTDIDNNTYTSNSTKDYEFNNGRLATVTELYASKKNYVNQETYQRIYSYEYDVAGNTIKYTNKYNGGGAILTYIYLYEYSNGKISKYSIIHPGGVTINYPVEANSNGYITKLLNPTEGSEQRFQYDAYGNRLVEEYWALGKIRDKFVYTYDNKPNYKQALQTRLKGFPKDLFGLAHYNNSNTFNLTKQERFDGSFVTTPVLQQTLNYTYQYNSKGHVTSFTETYTNGTGTTTNSGNNSYTNCN
jgi:hypothetical protein